MKTFSESPSPFVLLPKKLPRITDRKVIHRKRCFSFLFLWCLLSALIMRWMNFCPRWHNHTCSRERSFSRDEKKVIETSRLESDASATLGCRKKKQRMKKRISHRDEMMRNEKNNSKKSSKRMLAELYLIWGGLGMFMLVLWAPTCTTCTTHTQRWDVFVKTRAAEGEWFIKWNAT